MRVLPRRPVTQFADDETGAATVDWVVLCAAVTLATLVMLDQVGAGLGIFSDNVTEELTGTEVVRAGEENFVGFEFTDGYSGRWSGASVTNIPGFGEALGPIGGSGGRPSVTHDFIMASDIETSTISFDLYGLDSLDNESGIIFINGVEVGRVISNHSGTRIISAGVDGISFDGEKIAENVDIGGFRSGDSDGRGIWKDDITAITISVENPGDLLSFGFGSDANQAVNDEAYAIDNFKISGVDVNGSLGNGTGS